MNISTMILGAIILFLVWAWERLTRSIILAISIPILIIFGIIAGIGVYVIGVMTGVI